MDEANKEGERRNNFFNQGPIFDPANDIGGVESIVSMEQKIFITSDTHFFHKNILVYEAENRPFKDRDDMNEQLISRWNSVVGKDDVVFHLGDFSFGNATRIKDIVSRLNGKIYLLLGNHDRVHHYDWKELGFHRVFDRPFLFDGKFIMSHEPLDAIPEGKINIYGHVHGNKFFNTIDPNRMCVCVERHNCTPVTYEYIKGQFSV